MAALITRCPACATMFKVVPDQLRVSDGWVRCGHCGEVFDARAHMQEPAAVAQAQSADRDMIAAPPQAAPSVDRAAATQDSHVDDDFPSGASSEPAPQTEVPSSAFDDAVPVSEFDPAELAVQAETLVEDPLDRPFALRREDLSGPAPLSSSFPQRFTGASGGDSEFEAAAPSIDEPTFVRQARRQARWRHPVARGLLLLLALALAAVLVLQVAIQERDRLAAARPDLRPLLTQLCAAAGCRIAPPRQIDAIAIDSSSFNKLRPDAYRLQVTLKNQGRVEVAMPALELTLTDSDEQPVLRRVLMPREFAPARPTIAGSSEWSGTLAIAIADNSLASRVAGYRLLAFYP